MKFVSLLSSYLFDLFFFSSAPQAAPVDEPQVFIVEPLGTRPYSIYVYN